MSGPRLNPHQAEAVHHVRGPLLIFAGAGSGKTRVITHRIQYMLQQGIASSCIVAVSFTNKSAKEMKHRLQRMAGSKALRGMVLSTFHALGNRILQKEIRILGYRDPFSILDSHTYDRVSNLHSPFSILNSHTYCQVPNLHSLFVIYMAYSRILIVI